MEKKSKYETVNYGTDTIDICVDLATEDIELINETADETADISDIIEEVKHEVTESNQQN